MKNYLRLIKGYIFQRKVRSFLTIIGVFIGITAVFSLVSIGQGMQEFINEQFEIAGSNRIQVYPGGGASSISFAPGSSFVSAKLYEEDFNVVKDARGVDYAVGVLVKGMTIEFDDEIKAGYVLATHTDSETTKNLQKIDFFLVDEGRYLSNSDRHGVILGYGTASGFFEEDVDIGDRLKINGVDFTVVGITEKTGNPFQDQRSIIPIETAREMFNLSDEVSLIVATIKTGFEMDDVKENIKEDLRKSRNVKEGEEDFSVTTPQQLAETFGSILGLVTVFIIGIAAVSLIVGSVGIMNSMYTSVSERTRDIGIMKAVGARNLDIAMIFVIESGLLGLVGGIAGVVLGAIMAKGTEIAAQAADIGIFRSYVTIELVVATLSFSFLVGALSGLFPAIEASHLKPVEAFRKKK